MQQRAPRVPAGGFVVVVFLLLVLGDGAPVAAAQARALDPARVAAALRERGTLTLEVAGPLRLQGSWSLPAGTLRIHAVGEIVADDWRLFAPGSTLILEGNGVQLRGGTRIEVARRAGRGGTVEILGGDGTVHLDATTMIDASGATGGAGRIHLAGENVVALGSLLARGRGRIEVDARRGLRFLSPADTGGGLLRLDPTNLRIANFSGTNSNVAIAGGDVSPNAPPATGQLDAGFLATTLLASNDVIVHTTTGVGPGTGLHPTASPLAHDNDDGDISVEAEVAWSNAHTLSLLAHDDLIILANVQNGGTGFVVGVSGWDGTTTTGFTGSVASTAYGSEIPAASGRHGDTFVLGTANPVVANGVSFGSRGGTTALWGYDVTLRGSTAAAGTPGVNDDGYALVGYRVFDGTTASGAIQVNAHHDISLLGGDVSDDSERFAQIGHGGVLRKVQTSPPFFYTPGTTQGNLAGDITVHADNALTLDDGIHYGYTQIGHGGLIFQGQRGNLSGNITVSAATVNVIADWFVPGRPAGYSQIGHGGLLSSGFTEESVAGDYDGAITVNAGTLTMTAGSRNSSAAKIGHGGFTNWSDDGPTVMGNIGSHVAGGAPITVTVTGNIVMNHDTSAGRDGDAIIGHGGPVFVGATVGTILGNINVHADGNITMTGGGDCPNDCGTQIGHSISLESFTFIDAGAVQGDVTVTAGGDLSMTGGGLTNGGGQLEWTQIGHGGWLIAAQRFHGTVANPHLEFAGVPAAGADTNDVTVSAKSITVQGGKGSTAWAQIGHGGALDRDDMTGTMHVGPFAGKVTVTATDASAGDLQVLAGADSASGASYAQLGSGSQDVSPPTVTTPATVDGASGDVSITVPQETSLTNDAGGSPWWLGHRTWGPLTASNVRLDTGTLDFVAGHTGGATATISDPTFWDRFATPAALTGPYKANAESGNVELRVHGPAALQNNGNLISSQPLTVPAAITNTVAMRSTDDVTLSSPITNNSATSVVDVVDDDANPNPPNLSLTAQMTLAAGGAPAGRVELFAVSPGQLANASGYVPPATSFGVWYQTAGSAVIGENFKTSTTPDLSLTKSDGGASVAPGGTVAYTLTFANNGGVGATGVVLTDVVPANTTFNAGASTSGWSCTPSNNAGSTCTLAIGAVASAAGGSATFAVTVTNPLPAGVSQVSNTASIADDGTHGTDPTPGNNSGSDTTPVTGAPDLALTKSDGGASVAPGGTVSYTLTYSNTGNRGASGVVLTETVPANTTFNAGASTAGWICAPTNNAGSTCTLVVGTLAAGGGNQTATFAVTVTNPLPGGVTQISNTASIGDDGTNGTDPTPGNNSGSDTTPVTGAPDLAVTKSDGGASVAPGGTVSYTLTYSNTGNRGASGVVLTETVPANTTFNAGASTAGWSCTPNDNAGSTCTLAIGSLVAGGGNQTATFAVTVANPLPAGVTQISNTASIANDGTNGTDPTPGNNSGSDTTPVTGAPDLSLTKSDGGASVAPGGTVAYTLTYSNAGNRGASGVVLTETVPANSTFNAGASTAGWSCTPNNNAGSTCTLAIGSLVAGGGNQTATFAVTAVNPVPAGVTQISNTASIADNGTNGADPTPGDNSGSDTTPVTGAPDLSLTKSDGGVSVTPGNTVTYTLTYANGGNRGATGVVLTETVPADTTFNAGASTSGWICTPSNNAGSTCTLAVGALPAGGGSQTATFAVTVDNPVPGGVTQISNTASIADDGTNGIDPTPGNNSGSDTTPVVSAPDLSLTKSDGGASAAPGGTVSYTLTYANTGNVGATGVVLTDTVPANTTFNAGVSTAGWSCTPNNNAGSTCTLAVGAVATGAGNSATFAVTVINPLPAGVTQISNSASIADDGTNGTDPTPGNNSGSDTTPVTGAPDLAITKSDGGVSVAPGATVAYTLSYSNVGNRGATGVVLTETVPANTTFNAGASTAGWVCTPNGNAGSTCTLAVGAVAPGGGTQTATFAVTVASPLPAGVTQISNTASVADDGTNGADPSTVNNSGGDTTPVTGGPDLSLTKSDGGATVPPGGTVSYTLTFANTGTRGATGVVITETVPANTTFDSGASTAGWVCTPNGNAGSTCTLTIGSLAAGAGSQTATFAVTVVDPVPAGVTQVSNTASIADDGANGVDPAAGNNAGSDTTPIAAAAASNIPTLSAPGLIGLWLLIGAVGAWMLRRRRLG